MKKLALISALASAVLLAGCASAPKTHHNQVAYDPMLSRANNICNVFYLNGQRDQLAPDNVELRGSNIDAINSWTGTAAMTADIANLAGANALAGLYGAGLVLSLLSGPDVPDPCIAGYIPEADASTPNESRKVFIDRFMLSLRDGILAIDPKAKVTYTDDSVEDWSYDAQLDVVSDVLGCTTKEAEPYKTCEIFVATLIVPDEPLIGSTILGAEPGRYWIQDRSYLPVHFREGIRNEGKVDWNRVAFAAAKFMPPNTYLSMPVRKIDKNKFAPPFIVEKDRVNFFVVDKENFDKQTERFGKR